MTSYVEDNKPAGDDDGFLSVPAHVLAHNLGVHGDVLRGKLGQLVRLRVDPALKRGGVTGWW